MIILNKESVEALIRGASILGTGGGGSPKEGLRILMEDLDRGFKLRIVDVNEVSPESLIVCAYFCGAIAAPGEKKEEVFDPELMKNAVKTLEKYLGRKVEGVIATEIGGANTAIALHVASMLNLPLIDGDQVGRAVPELVHSTYYLFDVPAYPSVLVTKYGDTIIIDRYSSIEMYEKIAREISIIGKGLVFVVDSPILASKVKEIAILNTISKCIELGKKIMECLRSGRNVIKEIVTFLNGYYLFKGKVKDFNLEVKGGFLVGEVYYEGIDEWFGHTFKIWVKNENIIAWRDDKVIVMPPDLICVINDEGWGITNSDIERGLKVHIIGVKAPEIWRSKKGLEILGPRHFGFDLDYKPIEELVK